MKNAAEMAEKTMSCKDCNIDCQRFGQHCNGLQRFRCPKCHKTYTEPHKAALEGSYIPQDRVVLALRLLIEGNSIRSTERITDLDRNTIMKLLVLAGQKCERLLGDKVRNVPARDVQADEIWSFIGKKEKLATGWRRSEPRRCLHLRCN